MSGCILILCNYCTCGYYDMFAGFIKIFAPLIGGVWVLYLFTENNKVKRAEWLKCLFEKFYENTNYKECRKLLDTGNEVTIGQMTKDDDTEEKFTDYLNFFEFILSLLKLKQIRRNEVEMLFDYYLCNINSIVGIKDYLKKNGFENLLNDLDSFAKK